MAETENDGRKLSRIMERLADSVSETTDDEILAEEREAGDDPKKEAEQTRAILRAAIKSDGGSRQDTVKFFLSRIFDSLNISLWIEALSKWCKLAVTRSSFPWTKDRFVSRLKAPASPNDVRRMERWLATARVFLAIAALVAIWMDPANQGYSPWVYWFLGLYMTHGVVVMLLLRYRKQSTFAFRVLVHTADIVWPAFASLFAPGPQSPFFLIFIFALVAAAYRWGWRETFGTATAITTLLWLESLAVRLGLVAWLDHTLAVRGLPVLRVHVPDLEPKRLVTLSAYLLVMGLLLGYLAEQEKQLRAERAMIARVLGRVRVEEGLSFILREILGELLSVFGARRVLIASDEINRHRVFIAEVNAVKSEHWDLRWVESTASDRETYLFKSDVDSGIAFGKRASFQLVALDPEGVRLRNPSSVGLASLTRMQSFSSVAFVSFNLGREWWGRIFLLEPVMSRDVEEELRFLQELVRQVGPAIYNVYLLRRLRQRAGVVERARVARELHDGAVQSLIAMEMQVDVLRRESQTRDGALTPELGRIQGLLREEVLKLRDLMQQLKSLDVDAGNLLRRMREAVERFQRETGTSANFVSDLEQIFMAQRYCRELLSIVNEGLVNVRKHSGARHVLVRFGFRDGYWHLTIEDDGRGFPFARRYSLAELEALGKGPIVIRERVKLIGGELTVESDPSRGSRLEVLVPDGG